MSRVEQELSMVRDQLYPMFVKFYAMPENQERFNRLIPWITEKTLRTAEPLTSKFICEHNRPYFLKTTQGEYVPVNLLSVFDKLLRQYSKHLFDIIGRHTSLTWLLSNGQKFETTYCQFNFLKFMTEYHLQEQLEEFEKSHHAQGAIPFTGTKGKNYYMKRYPRHDTVYVYDTPQQKTLPLHPHPPQAVILSGKQSSSTEPIKYVVQVLPTEEVMYCGLPGSDENSESDVD